MKNLILLVVIATSFLAFAQDSQSDVTERLFQARMTLEFHNQRSDDHTRVEPYYSLEGAQILDEIELLEAERDYGVDSEEYKKLKLEKEKIQLERVKSAFKIEAKK